MSTIDPEDTPLDPDTGLPQEPVIDPVPDDDDEVTDELDGEVLADPDIALDEPPRATDDVGPASSATGDIR